MINRSVKIKIFTLITALLVTHLGVGISGVHAQEAQPADAYCTIGSTTLLVVNHSCDELPTSPSKPSTPFTTVNFTGNVSQLADLVDNVTGLSDENYAAYFGNATSWNVTLVYDDNDSLRSGAALDDDEPLTSGDLDEILQPLVDTDFGARGEVTVEVTLDGNEQYWEYSHDDPDSADYFTLAGLNQIEMQIEGEFAGDGILWTQSGQEYSQPPDVRIVMSQLDFYTFINGANNSLRVYCEEYGGGCYISQFFENDEYFKDVNFIYTFPAIAKYQMPATTLAYNFVDRRITRENGGINNNDGTWHVVTLEDQDLHAHLITTFSSDGEFVSIQPGDDLVSDDYGNVNARVYELFEDLSREISSNNFKFIDPNSKTEIEQMTVAMGDYDEADEINITFHSSGQTSDQIKAARAVAQVARTDGVKINGSGTNFSFTTINTSLDWDMDDDTDTGLDDQITLTFALPELIDQVANAYNAFMAAESLEISVTNSGDPVISVTKTDTGAQVTLIDEGIALRQLESLLTTINNTVTVNVNTQISGFTITKNDQNSVTVSYGGDNPMSVSEFLGKKSLNVGSSLTTNDASRLYHLLEEKVTITGHDTDSKSDYLFTPPCDADTLTALLEQATTGDTLIISSLMGSDGEVPFALALSEGQAEAAQITSAQVTIPQAVAFYQQLSEASGNTELKIYNYASKTLYRIATLLPDDTSDEQAGTICTADNYCTSITPWSLERKPLAVIDGGSASLDDLLAELTPSAQSSVDYYALIEKEFSQTTAYHQPDSWWSRLVGHAWADQSEVGLFMVHVTSDGTALIGTDAVAAQTVASQITQDSTVYLFIVNQIGTDHGIVQLTLASLTPDSSEEVLSALHAIRQQATATNYILEGDNFNLTVTTPTTTHQTTSTLRATLTTTSSDNFATLVNALTLYADETWTGTIVGQDYTIELIKGRINQIGFTAATTREQVEAAIAGTSGQFMVSFGSTSMMARNGKLVDIQIATITHQPLSIPSGENVPNNSRPQGCDAIAPVGTPDLFQVDRRGDKATLYFTPVRDFTDRYHVVFGHADGDERYGGIAMSVSAEQNNGVLAININNLDPSQTYAFKVAPVNNCAVGTWSNWLTTKGVSRAGSSVSKTYRYGGSTISVSNNVISKPRTSTPVNTQPLLEAGSVNPTPIKTVSRQPKHLTF